MRAFGSLRRDEGQTMSEYAIVLAVITPAILLALGLLSSRVQARVETVIGYFT